VVCQAKVTGHGFPGRNHRNRMAPWPENIKTITSHHGDFARSLEITNPVQLGNSNGRDCMRKNWCGNIEVDSWMRFSMLQQLVIVLSSWQRAISLMPCELHVAPNSFGLLGGL
jgi:hypothetical protein